MASSFSEVADCASDPIVSAMLVACADRSLAVLAISPAVAAISSDPAVISDDIIVVSLRRGGERLSQPAELQEHGADGTSESADLVVG